MFPQITIRHNIGNIIEIPNQLNPKVFTYISNNLAIGVTAIPVDNAIDFTSGAIILLAGSMGSENTEFLFASAHTDQGFTVAATKQPHNRGDIVAQVNYDQIEIYSALTEGGVYTLLATQSLYVTQQKTVVFDAPGLTTTYYKVRWKNSQTSDVSEFSSPISVLSYPEDSAGGVIYPVLKAMGVSEDDKKITIPFCLSAIDDARKYVKAKLYGIRHAWNEEFEYPIKVLAGSNCVDLPTNIDFKETDRSVLAARFLIGNVLAPFNLKYIDKRSWNQVAFQVMGGTTTTETLIGAVTIDLDSAGDFPATTNPATGIVATTDYDQEIMNIEYTAVNLITNQLTGVTGVTRAIPAGTRIWVTPTIAQPLYYSVWEGKLYFDRIVPDSMQGNNLYIDYYKRLLPVENLYQELPEPYREIYKWYLRYAIKYRKDITLDSSDPDLKKFEDLVQALFNNLYTGQDTIVVTS